MHIIIIGSDHKNHMKEGEFEYCVDHKSKKLNKINT